MLSLLLAAAALTPASGDASYVDLGHAKSATQDACIARYDNGAIEITQAYNRDAGTITNVAVVTGKSNVRIPVGTQLWVRAGFGPAWRALVTESTAERIRFVAHHRMAGDLFTSEPATIMLFRTLETGPKDAVFVQVAGDTSNFRGKLAAAFDCSDAMGI